MGLFQTAKVFAQSNKPANSHLQQVMIRHDNDFLLGTDRYYSAGLFFTYHKQLKKGIFFEDHEQFFVEVAQQAFTPTDIESIIVEDLDRAYASFLSVRGGWSLVNRKTVYATNLEVGFTGPLSGAGQLQRWFHRTLVNYTIPNWFSEIGTKVHANLEASVVQEVVVSKQNFGIVLAVQPIIVLGTKDRFLQQNFIAYFGKRGATNETSAHNQLSLKNELYFTLNVGFRYVAHNDLLTGVLTENSPALERTIENWVAHFNFALNYRSNKNLFLIGYKSNTPENLRSSSHRYLTVSYGRSF